MNIKKYVKQSLEDKLIIDLLADKKVYFLHANAPKIPYLEYEIVGEYGVDWAEGKEIATDYTVQVDVFSNTDYTEIEEEIGKVMINKGFKRIGAVDLWEEQTKLFHKALRFNISRLANG
ncbi:prohead protease [Clostridium gasigenes]|uniref:prohead protease n=1 Tax=Clostridium gasigenes TaxID=94869 RepID=UPI0014383ED0|nr:prohead protease [Clostridium gasigenes]NKF05302.1 prohead protease [Clostridium gasigenes]QSW18756.1 prohead protease [Clostridium gasigenes]